VLVRANRLHVGAERIVAREVAHRQVVRMNVFAGSDRLAGKTDDLVVAAHRLAGGNRPHRHLVAGGYQSTHAHAFDVHAADELAACDQHVVVGMQADERLN